MLSTSRAESPSFFEDLKLYVGFTPDAAAALDELRPLATPHYPRIVDDFYGAIQEHPGARAAITGGEAQISALKQTLTHWLDTLLAGPHDDAYFASRCRIGRVHVRIRLPQMYMFTAINRIRSRLGEVLARHTGHLAPERRQRMADAVQQVLDLDLAIMLETYREDLLARNRAAERLATFGQLAAGIGHELRNPLGVIESSLYLLRHGIGPDAAGNPKITRHLDRIAEEVRRSTDTINDLLALATDRPPWRLRTLVKPVVDAAVDACLLPAAVRVETSVPSKLIGDFDLDQLRHVLTNLVTNASQAMGGAGRVWVEAEDRAGTLALRVRDDGPGIPEGVRHQLFEPLFTTRQRGSGIGLTLCRRIVEAHGGSIELEPSAEGASFLIRVPPIPTAATPSRRRRG